MPHKLTTIDGNFFEAAMNKNHDTEAQKRLLGHVKLEPRRLLNADFDLMGGALLLDNFVDSNFNPIDNQVTVTQAGMIYSFVLDDGVWSGDDTAAEITGDGTNTLLIDISLGALSSIVMNSSTADQFDIEFGDFDFAGPLSSPTRSVALCLERSINKRQLRCSTLLPISPAQRRLTYKILTTISR